METSMHFLHHDGWQLFTWEERDTQKLNEVWVMEGTHELALRHELCHCLGSLAVGKRVLLKGVVDLFSSTYCSRYLNLIHYAIRSSTYIDASWLYIC